jgi:hypothetical protein
VEEGGREGGRKREKGEGGRGREARTLTDSPRSRSRRSLNWGNSVFPPETHTHTHTHTHTNTHTHTHTHTNKHKHTHTHTQRRGNLHKRVTHAWRCLYVCPGICALLCPVCMSCHIRMMP